MLDIISDIRVEKYLEYWWLFHVRKIFWQHRDQKLWNPKESQEKYLFRDKQSIHLTGQESSYYSYATVHLQVQL